MIRGLAQRLCQNRQSRSGGLSDSAPVLNPIGRFLKVVDLAAVASYAPATTDWISSFALSGCSHSLGQRVLHTEG